MGRVDIDHGGRGAGELGECDGVGVIGRRLGGAGEEINRKTMVTQWKSIENNGNRKENDGKPKETIEFLRKR